VSDREEEAGLLDLADDFAEEGVDDDRAFREHAPELEHATERRDEGRADEGQEETGDEGDQEGHGGGG